MKYVIIHVLYVVEKVYYNLTVSSEWKIEAIWKKNK